MQHKTTFGPYLFAVLIWLAGAVLTGCGGEASNPAPSITSVTPAKLAAGSSGFRLTVNGSGFTTNSQVSFNSSAKSVTFVNSGQVTTEISASDIAASGTVKVIVQTPSPGGGSATADFVIDPPNVPVLSSVTPASVPPGSNPQITVSGSGFVRASKIVWNGTPMATNYIDNTQLSAQLTSANTVAGSAQVAVITPAPGGGSSSSTQVGVHYPVPSVTSITPSTLQQDTPQTLTIKGSDFFAGATVYLNGSSRVTTFVSSSELGAVVLATDVAAPSTLNVTVTNPTPTPGSTLNYVVPVKAPIAVLSLLRPSTWIAATAASYMQLVLKGSSFKAAQILWNGALNPNVTATRLDDFTITATIPPSLSAQPSDVTIQVQNVGSDAPSAPQVLHIVPSGAGVQSVSIKLDPPYATEIASATGDLQYVSSRYTSGSVVRTAIYQTCIGAPAGCTPHEAASFGAADTDNPDVTTGTLSETGRFGLYWKGNKTLGTGGQYLYDTCIGAPAPCTPSEILLTGTPELQGFDTPHPVPAVTPDGQYVLMSQPGAISYLRKTCFGVSNCTPESIPVSYWVPFWSYPPDPFISPDAIEMTLNGRYIFFSVNSAGVIIVNDTCIGAGSGCATSTNPGMRPSGDPIALLGVSQTGRMVGWLDNNTAAPGMNTTMLMDTCEGVAPCTPTTRIGLYTDTITLAGTAGYIASLPDNPRFIFSPDSSKYAFSSTIDNLVANDTNELADTFVIATCAGYDPLSRQCVNSGVRTSVDSQGVQFQQASRPIRFSPDSMKLLMSNGQLVTLRW